MNTFTMESKLLSASSMSIYSDTPHLDEILSTLPTVDDYIAAMFENDTSHLDDLFPIENQPNETENWFFDSKSTNYERVKKLALYRAPLETSLRVNRDDAEDYFQDYILYMIEKNLLKKELNKGKAIKDSVIYAWYKQFIQRTSMEEAQDVHQRCLGKFTQAETTKIKAYEKGDVNTPYTPQHHIKNMESNGFKVGQMLNKIDPDLGKGVGQSPDFYVPEEHEDTLEEVSENAHMKHLLSKRFSESDVESYYELWLQMRHEAFSNQKAWAQARRTTVRLLKKQIKCVQNIFLNNIEDFGYDRSQVGH